MHPERGNAARDRLEEYAFALNDSIVQGLAAAKMALEMEEVARARSMINQTLQRAQEIIADLMNEVGTDIRPGSLVRTEREDAGGNA
jgi:hypothetical protein